MNLYHELPPGPDWPAIVYMVVEIPKKSRNKYEYDVEGGFVKLDRVLFSPLHYPGDYGFIPQTLHPDGDPLDILVITNEPTFSGCVIEARPVGIFQLTDKGEKDDKILAVPNTDSGFSEYRTLEDVPSHFLNEMAHFFTVYKDLESVRVKAHGWKGLKAAHESVEKAVKLYRKRVHWTG